MKTKCFRGLSPKFTSSNRIWQLKFENVISKIPASWGALECKITGQLFRIVLCKSNLSLREGLWLSTMTFRPPSESPSSTIPILRCKTHQHVHKNNWHSQYKQKEQDIRQYSVFQFTPRHKVVGVVEFTQCHYKDGHHGVRKSGIWLLKIKISG